MPTLRFLTLPQTIRCTGLAIVLTEFAQLAQFQTMHEQGDFGRGHFLPSCAMRL
jgi:hypothetical protein